MDAEIQRSNNFIKQFHAEKDDRMATIVAAIYVDKLMEEVIFSFCINGIKTDDVFGDRCLLGSMSDKIKFLHVTGCISVFEYYCLETIRKIRNLCVHELEITHGSAVKFDKAPISDHIDNLVNKLPKEFFRAIIFVLRTKRRRRNWRRAILDYLTSYMCLSLMVRKTLLVGEKRISPPDHK